MRVALLGLLVACASSPPPPRSPDLQAIKTTTPPPHGQLIASCLGDAVANQRVGYAQDTDTTLLLFTCEGAPARAFFDALGPWSARIDSEAKRDGSILRSTTRVRRDLFGVDYCLSDGAIYQCVVTLNAGDFVRKP